MLQTRLASLVPVDIVYMCFSADWLISFVQSVSPTQRKHKSEKIMMEWSWLAWNSWEILPQPLSKVVVQLKIIDWTGKSKLQLKWSMMTVQGKMVHLRENINWWWGGAHEKTVPCITRGGTTTWLLLGERSMMMLSPPGMLNPGCRILLTSCTLPALSLPTSQGVKVEWMQTSSCAKIDSSMATTFSRRLDFLVLGEFVMPNSENPFDNLKRLMINNLYK